MAALTADRITSKKMTGNLKSHKVKDATKIFAGSMVAVQADGHAVPASDAAALKVVGLAKNTVDNSSGADGDLDVLVEEGLFKLDATSITQAMEGQIMYVADDHTFDETLGTNGVKAGRLLEFISTTEGWIFISPAGVGTVLTDIAAFTDPPAAAEMALLRTFVNDLKAIINKWL